MREVSVSSGGLCCAERRGEKRFRGFVERGGRLESEMSGRFRFVMGVGLLRFFKSSRHFFLLSFQFS